jgi:hypothetical protein
MEKPTSSQPPPPAFSGLRRLAVKAATLITLGLVLGLGYDWAAPRLYGPERIAGFRLGIMHGGLMPVALPSLLLGKDVPIYADRNRGRSYKLGYIVGINACGFLFFGLAFWRPAQRSVKGSEGSARDQ